jgi:hypothetical protein
MAINYSEGKNKNTVFGGNKGITVPKGSDAQRVVDPNNNNLDANAAGLLRYNTDSGLAEFYTASGWSPVAPPPVVNGISGTINEDTDSVVTVTGSGFSAGAVVIVKGAAVSDVDRELVTTFVNSNTVTFNTNASVQGYVAGASFDVAVRNPSGLSGVVETAGTVDADPLFNTASGLIATVNDGDGAAQVTEANIGGTDYRIFTFLQGMDWNPGATVTADALIVGAGGGGGSSLAGGGGGGAVLFMQGRSLSAQSYPIRIGTGGNGIRSTAYNGRQGGSTTAFGETATGGAGAYGRYSTDGTPVGANGAGGAASSAGLSPGTSGTAPSASGDVTVYAGFKGGDNPGNSGSNYPGGGGAGAGANGQSPSTTDSPGGNGGNGVQINIDGNNYYWGAGGGGSTYTGSNGGGNGGLGGGGGGACNTGTGGSGGGTAINLGDTAPNGNGDSSNQFKGGDGGRNTGGGGGGGAHEPGPGGMGGSGIVIVRYPKSQYVGPTIASVSASDPDGQAVTYSLASGSLPTGCTLDSSTGEIKGYPTKVNSQTNYPFTISATSNGQTATRSFSITVNPTKDGSSAARAADSAADLASLGFYGKDWYWINTPNGSGAQKVFCDLDTQDEYGNRGWMLVGAWDRAEQWTTKGNNSKDGYLNPVRDETISSRFGDYQTTRMRVHVDRDIKNTASSALADFYYDWETTVPWKTVWAPTATATDRYWLSTGSSPQVNRCALRPFGHSYNLKYGYQVATHTWNNLADYGYQNTQNGDGTGSVGGNTAGSNGYWDAWTIFTTPGQKFKTYDLSYNNSYINGDGGTFDGTLGMPIDGTSTDTTGQDCDSNNSVKIGYDDSAARKAAAQGGSTVATSNGDDQIGTAFMWWWIR